MADVLGVSAGKVCYPVAFFILVKACDLLFHYSN